MFNTVKVVKILPLHLNELDNRYAYIREKQSGPNENENRNKLHIRPDK